MKKGDRPNPGEEFLYHLYLKPEFQLDLKNARKRLGIPKEGFKNRKERNVCLKQPIKTVIFVATLEAIIRDYKIPSAYTSILDEYIFFDDAYLRKQEMPSVTIIESPTGMLGPKDISMENYYWDSGEPYAKLLIPGNSRKSDVVKYIEKNWKEVEAILKKQDWEKSKKIRRTKNKERNKFIKDFWPADIKELQKYADIADPDSAPHRSRYKDLLIQAILKDKFGKINEGYIRKIGSKK